MSSLLQIGVSGIMGNQANLQTTSNNIANLNTPGYTRQRTELTSRPEFGLGSIDQNRIFDKFAIEQFRRDTSGASYYKTYADNTFVLDTYFSDENTSIAKGMDDVFQRLNEANDDPTAITPRQLTLSDAQALISRMQGLSERVIEQEEIINDELELVANETNSILNSLFEINQQIVSMGLEDGQPKASMNLFDERDELVRELSETLSLSIIDQNNGGIIINTKEGQPLMLQGAVYNFRAVPGDPDPNRQELEIYDTKSNSNVISLANDDLGGKLGALMDFRKDVLDETINSLGQLAIAFADAMNEQNKLGVDLQGNLGGDIFNVPATRAFGYEDNSSQLHEIDVRVEAGLGGSVTNFDYFVEFTSPTQYTIQPMQAGELIGTATGPLTVGAGYNGSAAGLPDGIEIDFDPLSTNPPFVAGDSFLVRPTRLAGVEIELALDDPEQLALAAPLTVEKSIDNLGTADISLESVTSTDTTNAPLNESAFAAGGGFDTDGPASIVVNAAGQFEVYDSTATLIATVPNGENIMEQITTGALWPGALNVGPDYPGYDVSITGTVEPGDTFNLAYNNTSLDNNFNGLKLADIQSEDVVRRNVAGTGENSVTLGETYSNLIGYVGDTANRANINRDATTAVLEQSENRVADASGVNLDEEAADLVKFEQAYNASARIVTIAQELFDTILSSVR
ncbi:flagellar hook-associated protein FlgK [Catenovulum sp. SM1970]|uniref:flagellar hook-associated protein FlgK n=1 Tax=Marinifaba aquimaris TaxID=2741323 RepID=UPI001573E26E|nr:flagellar hook-associated protein FlgK [Marinifaba aquimaris]NTS75395.1 flagellar hook-associated protein FlgK [Marinifaba aquimaris]